LKLDKKVRKMLGQRSIIVAGKNILIYVLYFSTVRLLRLDDCNTYCRHLAILYTFSTKSRRVYIPPRLVNIASITSAPLFTGWRGVLESVFEFHASSAGREFAGLYSSALMQEAV
jgi:hypothetical protein